MHGVQRDDDKKENAGEDSHRKRNRLPVPDDGLHAVKRGWLRVGVPPGWLRVGVRHTVMRMVRVVLMVVLMAYADTLDEFADRTANCIAVDLAWLQDN